MDTDDPTDRTSAFPLPESGATPIDPTPALPLPGEGADQSLRKNSGTGTINSSPWQWGGWEGVNCPEPKTNNEDAASTIPKPYSHPKTIFNPADKKSRRQTLRKNLTAPERFLWQYLRNKQLGVKFRRQHGVGPYIADFYCPECALVIELDGESHFTHDAKEYDHQRDIFMQTAGINVLRFTNNEIAENIEGVIQAIIDQIHKQ